jgi:ribosomal protein L37E
MNGRFYTRTSIDEDAKSDIWIKLLIMRIIEFIEKFPDEASCKDRFKTLRDEAGVTCKKCGTQKQYWLAAKEQYQCSSCGFRTTLRSGTLLQNSHLPYSYWFIAIHLLTSTKKVSQPWK